MKLFMDEVSDSNSFISRSLLTLSRVWKTCSTTQHRLSSSWISLSKTSVMTMRWKCSNSAVNEASPPALVELSQPMWSCSLLKLSIAKYIFNTRLSANRHESLLFRIEHQRIFGQSERDRFEGHRTWCRYQSTYCSDDGTISDSTSNGRSETKQNSRNHLHWCVFSSQGEPSFAMEITGTIRSQNLTTVQNIRVWTRLAEFESEIRKNPLGHLLCGIGSNWRSDQRGSFTGWSSADEQRSSTRFSARGSFLCPELVSEWLELFSSNLLDETHPHGCGEIQRSGSDHTFRRTVKICFEKQPFVDHGSTRIPQSSHRVCSLSKRKRSLWPMDSSRRGPRQGAQQFSGGNAQRTGGNFVSRRNGGNQVFSTTLFSVIRDTVKASINNSRIMADKEWPVDSIGAWAGTTETIDLERETTINREEMPIIISNVKTQVTTDGRFTRNARNIILSDSYWRSAFV